MCKSRILQQLEDQVISEGFEVGSPDYIYRMLHIRVQTCRSMRSFTSCNECEVYDECTYVKDYFREYSERQTAMLKKRKDDAERRERAARG